MGRIGSETSRSNGRLHHARARLPGLIRRTGDLVFVGRELPNRVRCFPDHRLRIATDGSLPACSYAVFMQQRGARWLECGARRRWRRGAVYWLSIAVSAGALVVVPTVADAASFSSVPTTTWVTNGLVDSVLPAGKVVYIGGAFSYVGPNTGSGVPLGLRSGSALARFPRINGTVRAVVSDGHGGYYIGGSFDRVGGVLRVNLAHVTVDGRVVSTWDPDPTGEVLALSLRGSILYVGGQFTLIGGRARDHIAALSARTGRPLP